MMRNVKPSSSSSSRGYHLAVLCETQDCRTERHKHADRIQYQASRSFHFMTYDTSLPIVRRPVVKSPFNAASAHD